MAYPTLKSLHRRLLREGKIDELADILATFDSAKRLDNALEDYKLSVNVSLARTVVRKFDSWLAGSADISDLYIILSDFPANDKKQLEYMKFFLEGYVNPNSGLHYVARRTAEILDTVPRNMLKFLESYVGNTEHHTFRDIIDLYIKGKDKDGSFETVEYAIARNFTRNPDLQFAPERFRKIIADFSSVSFEKHTESYKLAREIVEKLAQLPKETYERILISEDTFSPERDGMAKALRLSIEAMNSGKSAEVDKLLSDAVKFYILKDEEHDLKFELRGLNISAELAVKDLKQMADPLFKKFVLGLERMREPMKKVKRSDHAEAFEQIDAIDELSGRWLISMIYACLKGGPGSIADTSRIASSRRGEMYRAFKELPDEVQDGYIENMQTLADNWYEKQQEKIAADKMKWPPEVPPGVDAPLEDYAFADQRKDTPDEPNTPEEDRLYELLKGHFVDNSPISIENAELIRDMLIKGYYGSVFKEPKQPIIYRGMVVKKPWLAKPLNTEDFAKSGNSAADFDYTPRDDGVSSWTTSAQMARGFAANANEREGEYGVVLAAKLSDNHKRFIEGEHGLYNVKGLEIHGHESECIALGIIHVTKVFWKLGASPEREDMVKWQAEQEK